MIIWRFWLFIDFRLVVILLLVVQGSEGFLPVPPSWPELLHHIFLMRSPIDEHLGGVYILTVVTSAAGPVSANISSRS